MYGNFSELAMAHPNIHPHCFTCVNSRKCTAEPKQGLSCKIVSCPYACGMMFHECKMREHFQLCLDVKVPCYNVESGCPRTMKRKNLANHLSVCPASVVRCTMEWHRSLKLSERIPRKVIHPHCLNCINIRKCATEPQYGFSCKIIPCPLSCGVVFHACKSDKHLLICPNEKVPCRNAKRGCLSKVQRKNLSIHLISCPAINALSNAESNKKQLEAYNEDLSASTVCTRQQPLDIALALRDLKILHQHHSNNYAHRNSVSTDCWNYPHRIYPIALPTNAPSDGQEELHLVAENAHGDGESQSANNFNLSENGFPELDVQLGEIVLNSEAASQSHPKEGNNEYALASLINNLRRLASNHHGVCTDDCNKEQIHVNGYVAKYAKNELNDCDNWEKAASEGILVDNKSDRGASHFDTDAIDAILTYPTRFMGLHPSLDSPARDYEYTFFCSQEFRRDEYPWHYKNVHADIHGGLNGWLLERCPLAIYGCPFSRQRLNPLPKNSKIIFNEFLEAFNVSPLCPVLSEEEQKNMSTKDSSGAIDMCDLPFEVLQHIIRYLDSAGLLNLSHTCRAMYAVCETLLTERGIVTINWQRITDDDGTLRWMDAGKKWSFSSHFSPIHDWAFKGGSCMSNHLKVCKFYERNIRTAPHRLGEPLDDSGWKTYQQMKDGCQLGRQPMPF